MKAQRHIELALSEIRENNKGFSPDAEDMQLGLDVLNSMLSHWSSLSILIPYRTRETFTLVAGTGTYTIGSSGTLNTVRPITIDAAVVKDSNSRQDLTIVDVTRWSWITDETVTGLPSTLMYEPQVPLGMIRLGPTPGSAYTLELWSTKPLTRFTALTTDDVLPDEFQEVIRTNLAMKLAPHFGKTAAQDTQRAAITGLNHLKGQALANRVPLLEVDRGLRGPGRFDINSG